MCKVQRLSNFLGYVLTLGLQSFILYNHDMWQIDISQGGTAAHLDTGRSLNLGRTRWSSHLPVGEFPRSGILVGKNHQRIFLESSSWPDGLQVGLVPKVPTARATEKLWNTGCHRRHGQAVETATQRCPGEKSCGFCGRITSRFCGNDRSLCSWIHIVLKWI